TNPSPYMYLFRFDGFDVVGSSPEALVMPGTRTATVRGVPGRQSAGVRRAGDGHPKGRGPAPGRQSARDPDDEAADTRTARGSVP
ncbi:hypothetical protein AB0L81_36610, partial [Streptomyces sp. NPDC052127]